ncbi:MAG TPA: flagellar biosynthetic protein FliR [Verrucomicrobiae bacterium]|nr:flagellar biosynthetic protein FliR [Verrucomicrobiae bacterium]
MELDFYNWVLVFVRVGAFLLALPFFSAVNFPVMMRIALSALTALMISPQLPPFTVDHLNYFSLIGLMFREVSIGLLLGFIGRIIFYAVDIAGMIISSELGLSMGQVFDPSSQQSEQVPGLMLSFLAILTMLTLDLHHGLLLGFVKTFEVLPIGGGHLSPSLFELVVGRTGQIFSVALQIAAPVMAVSIVITVFFSIMSRAVPQMNVFAESFGIRIAGGLIVFGFTLQITAQYVANHLRRIPEDLMYVGQLLNGG